MQDAEQIGPESVGAALLDVWQIGALALNERAFAFGGIAGRAALVRAQARQGDERGGDPQERRPRD